MVQNPQQEQIRRLDMLVTFRRHDYYGGYPLNLTALCLWLCRTAEKHGMKVGQLMCVSNSAHLYERDWAAAQEVIAKYKPPTVQWDPRSVFHVEHIEETTCSEPDWVKRSHRRTKAIRATVYAPSKRTPGGDVIEPDGQVIEVFEAPTPGALLLKIGRSGLVSSIAHGLWLGREVERVSRGGR